MNTRQTLAAVSVVVIATMPSFGQVCGFENLKILPGDGAAGDFFGESMAISGSTAIIGAPRRDPSGAINTGTAYLFNATNGIEIHELVPSPISPVAFFGRSVAIENLSAIIGAPYDGAGDMGTDPATGAAYVFSTVLGTQLQRLLADDGADGDHFGASVALSGNVVAVGSPQSAGNFGSVYLFDRITGAQVDKLISPNAIIGDGMGTSVAMDGTTLVAGGPEQIFDQPTVQGAAFVFDTTTMTQSLLLLASDGFFGDGAAFGSSVAIDGDFIVVGAPLDDANGPDAGAAYVYDANTGVELFKLLPNSFFSTNHSEFGTSVSINGNRVIVGAPGMSADSGESFVFDLTTGEQIAELKASDPFLNDRFGESVAMSNSAILAGAYLSFESGINSGSVYRFDPNPTSCPADLTGDCLLNFFDVSAFLSAFAAENPIADYTGDGVFNFFDVSAFLSAFAAGCP